ncbi:hypothetical protein TruAng_011886 [Truncatella angustata]|nr:hypothetical protein TruAng_011886 [Truncatella angustata]
MDRLLGSCLGLISGSPWRTVKAAVEAPFLHQSTRSLVTEVQEFTKTYMSALGVENEVFRNYGKLHPVRDLKLLPFLFTARVVYGSLDAGLEEELRDLVRPREELFKSVVGGGATRYAFSRFLPLPAIRALHDFKDRWAAWSDRAHDFALKTQSGKAEAPVIGMYKYVDAGVMTREQLLQTLDEMLFANIDVTMGGLSWTLVFLAANPAVQNALRNEIWTNSSRTTTSTATRDDYLLSSSKTTPTLLGACILESARLRPLAAFSVPQSCPSPRTLDGFEIPAGTNFVVDSYALNIRDPFWGDDREKFRPQRWLERQKSGRDLRYRFWRFGFGPRTCLGKHMAELVLRSVIVELMENWSISLNPTLVKRGEQIGREDGDDEGEENMDWSWDDEMWIHHPDLMLRCEPLTGQSVKD